MAGRGRPGAIVRQPKAGGTPRVLDRGAVAASGLMISADSIYWLDDVEEVLASAPLR